MPTISLTEGQRDRLGDVQAALEADLAYGHVRPRDAIEYLLDQYEAVEGGATDNVPDTPASESASPDSGESTTEGTSEKAHERENEETAAEENTSAEVTSDASTAADEKASTEVNASTSTSDSADTPTATTTRRVTDASEESTLTPTGGDSRLNSMMNLLAEHDGKWREAGGGEEKYVVDLPDGTTEPARTKDDVRAHLFKHYR